MNETDSSASAWLTAKGQIRESVFCAQFLKQHPILSIGKFFIIRSVAGYAADSSDLFGLAGIAAAHTAADFGAILTASVLGLRGYR